MFLLCLLELLVLFYLLSWLSPTQPPFLSLFDHLSLIVLAIRVPITVIAVLYDMSRFIATLADSSLRHDAKVFPS